MKRRSKSEHMVSTGFPVDSRTAGPFFIAVGFFQLAIEQSEAHEGLMASVFWQIVG